MQTRIFIGLLAVFSLLAISFRAETSPVNDFGSAGDPTFSAVASAVVNASQPDTVLGQSNLMVDGAPEIDSYFRFNVSGLSGPVGQATLQITAAGDSGSGYFVRSVADNGWDPSSITFANAPAMGEVLGSSGTFSAGMLTSVDVTSAITGDGSFSFALTSTDPLPVSFSGTAQLVILPAIVAPTSSGPAFGSQTPGAGAGPAIPAVFPGATPTAPVSVNGAPTITPVRTDEPDKPGQP